MSAFRHALASSKQKSKPPVVVLEPTCWKATAQPKPISDVAVGIRLIAQADLDSARAEAAKYAIEMHDKPSDIDGRIEAYNERLMAWIVSHAVSDPNDPATAHPSTLFRVDHVATGMVPTAIRRLYDAYEALTIEQSPLIPPITEPEFAALVIAVQGGAIDRLPPDRALRARRLLRFVLDEFTEEDFRPHEVSDDMSAQAVREAVLVPAG